MYYINGNRWPQSWMSAESSQNDLQQIIPIRFLIVFFEEKRLQYAHPEESRDDVDPHFGNDGDLSPIPYTTIHVWYIYLHLVDFYGFHVGKYTGKYTSPMDAMGFVCPNPSFQNS